MQDNVNQASPSFDWGQFLGEDKQGGIMKNLSLLDTEYLRQTVISNILAMNKLMGYNFNYDDCVNYTLKELQVIQDNLIPLYNAKLKKDI